MNDILLLSPGAYTVEWKASAESDAESSQQYVVINAYWPPIEDEELPTGMPAANITTVADLVVEGKGQKDVKRKVRVRADSRAKAFR